MSSRIIILAKLRRRIQKWEGKQRTKEKWETKKFLHRLYFIPRKDYRHSGMKCNKCGYIHSLHKEYAALCGQTGIIGSTLCHL